MTRLGSRGMSGRLLSPGPGKGGPMIFRHMRRSSLALFILVLGAVPTAQAQVAWSFRAGVVRPAGTFDDYFDFGPTVGVEAAYPLRDRVDVVAGADFDHYNG